MGASNSQEGPFRNSVHRVDIGREVNNRTVYLYIVMMFLRYLTLFATHVLRPLLTSQQQLYST